MSADDTEASPDEEEFRDLEALQNALRAEHAAVYGYAFVGANCTGADRERSYSHLDAHRTQRDTLRSELIRINADPAASESAYELPDSTDQETLDTFAARLEERASRGYLRLAAAGDATLRELAARSLQKAAVRGLDWGAELADLPGFPGGTGDPDSEDFADD